MSIEVFRRRSPSTEVGIDDVAELCQLFLRQVGNPALVRNTGALADALGAGAADAVDICQCDLHPLLGGNVYTRNSCHCLAPLKTAPPLGGPVILRLRRNRLTDGPAPPVNVSKAANYRRLPYAVNLNAVRYPNMPSIASATSSIDAIPSTVRISPFAL